MTASVTMDEYLTSRMVRWPLRLLDMDVPVDGGDAFVITTAERAADLPLRPVLVHALRGPGTCEKLSTSYRGWPASGRFPGRGGPF